VNDPKVLELRRKVEVVQDAAIPVEAAALELWTRDGAHHRIAVAAARGSASRPLTDRELEQKFEALAAARLKDGGRRLIDAVWALDKLEDASTILAMTVPG
jgi:2-methylcitrate dehydratase PrpD